MDGDGDQQAAQVLDLAPGEELLEAEGPVALLFGDSGLNVQKGAADDVLVVGRKSVNGGDDAARFLVAIVRGEPARCLG